MSEYLIKCHDLLTLFSLPFSNSSSETAPEMHNTLRLTLFRNILQHKGHHPGVPLWFSYSSCFRTEPLAISCTGFLPRCPSHQCARSVKKTQRKLSVSWWLSL